MAFNQRFYDLDEGRLSVLHIGPSQDVIDSEPPKLVFMHANGFNARTYRKLLEYLPIHSVAIDIRGHGLSELPLSRKFKDFHYLNQDILAFLKGHITTPYMLAGHSLGGTLAILACEALAKQGDDLLRSAVMIDPPTLPSFISWLMRIPGVTERLSIALPIGRKALNRHRVFASREALFKRYSEKRALKAFDRDMLRDYIEGGTREHEEGVELTCPPWFEARIYGAHAHNIYRAARYLPKFSKILQVRGKGVTTKATRAKMKRIAGSDDTGADIASYNDELSHMFPVENPKLAANILLEMLTRSGLILASD